jgi:bifunctional DNA-binding transcriptional regulator/antitoxin component of YhaV-PrlF toxin-antitoxin module
MMHFHTVLLLAGKTATGVEVPAEVVERMGAGKRPAVHVTINGYSYRSTVAVMGGVFMLPVSAEVRTAAGITAGDTVEVQLALDTEPRTVPVPTDLAAALDATPAARQAFERLSYSHKRQHVLAVEDAKTPETRQRRIAKTISTLLG